MSNQIPSDLIECAREMSMVAVRYRLRNFSAVLTPGVDCVWCDPVEVFWTDGGQDLSNHEVTVMSKVHVQVGTTIPRAATVGWDANGSPVES